MLEKVNFRLEAKSHVDDPYKYVYIFLSTLMSTEQFFFSKIPSNYQ